MNLSEIKNILVYKKEQGCFIWKENRGSRGKKGNVAGYRRKNGYVTITINKKEYYAHRLVWMYEYGTNPKKEIDHIDGNPSNNYFKNLRIVSHKLNQKNKKRPCHNTSGHIGVYKIKLKNGIKWRASVFDGEKDLKLGVYEKKEDAIFARMVAQRALGYHKNHGR